MKFEGRLGFDHFDSNQLSNIEWSVDYPDGYFRNYDRRTTEINADFIGYFTKQFGDFNVNALAGANYRDYAYEINTIGADQLTVPGLYTVANAKGTAYTAQNHETRRSNSVYANLSLGWKISSMRISVCVTTGILPLRMHSSIRHLAVAGF